MVSTPYMDEAQRCDRIALIHEGQILDIRQPKGFNDEAFIELLANTQH